MGKMVVLKPVVWNDNGYIGPAGIPATGGFSQKHGYGHEEWSGRSDWIWQGWRIFHTEAKGLMHDYAAKGELAIIPTTMHGGEFFALGVGCNVYENNDADRAGIADALGLKTYARDMWRIEAIRERKASRADLEAHWRSHMGANWRCPQTHFVWFGKPARIVPNDVIPATPPRQAIAKMHGSYQAVRPDQALAIVRDLLAPDHPVIAWLSTDDFDPVRNEAVRKAPPPKNGGRRSASTTTDPMIRYMQEYELVITPRHHILQNDFEAYLKSVGARSIRANIDRVDLRFNDPGHGLVLAEIKPTDAATVRFAIRLAMGQLLDYSQRATGDPGLLIVVDDQPSDEDKQLALTNGFGIAWRNKNSFDLLRPIDV